MDESNTAKNDLDQGPTFRRVKEVMELFWSRAIAAKVAMFFLINRDPTFPRS
jgi:hypothetical protein